MESTSRISSLPSASSTPTDQGVDEQHYVTLYIEAPRPLAKRIGQEFLSEMQYADPPEGWRETWPEIKRIEEIACHSANSPR
jgi:hypothetical protein